MKIEVLPVKWDRKATESLKKAVKYIAYDSPSNAKNVMKTLLRLSHSLGRFPNKFPRELVYEDIPGNYRSVSKWNWKIVYEVTSKEVVILQVFDTRQDPAKFKARLQK